MASVRTAPSSQLGTILADPSTFGFTLLTIFLDLYCADGPEPLKWTPAVIQMELEQDFGIDLPPGNYDRLMTAINIFTANNFFVSLPDFNRACVVLSGHVLTPGLFMLPDSVDLAWGITEALLINPPDDKDEDPFVPEITAFIGHVLDNEGVINPPDVLRIATRKQDQLSRIRYDYSDDQELFDNIMKTEKGKTDDINETIRSSLIALLAQLATLPLQHGNASSVAAKLLKNLPKEVK